MEELVLRLACLEGLKIKHKLLLKIFPGKSYSLCCQKSFLGVKLEVSFPSDGKHDCEEKFVHPFICSPIMMSDQMLDQNLNRLHQALRKDKP